MALQTTWVFWKCKNMAAHQKSAQSEQNYQHMSKKCWKNSVKKHRKKILRKKILSKKLNNFWFVSSRIVLLTDSDPKFHRRFRFVSTFSTFFHFWEIFMFLSEWSHHFPYEFWILLEKMKKRSKVKADFS